MNIYSAPLKRKLPRQEIRRIRRVVTKSGYTLYAVQHQFTDGSSWSFMKYTDPMTQLRMNAIFKDNETAMMFMQNPDMFDIRTIDDLVWMFGE